MSNQKAAKQALLLPLIGLTSPDGVNAYVLEYTTPGIEVGALVSLISLLLILAMMALEKRKKG